MPGTPATTPRLGIARYANSDTVDFAGQVNAVSDRVDVTAGRFESGLLAARPSTGAGVSDRYYFATDTGELYRDAGGATPTWVFVTRRDVPILTGLPGTPYDGQEMDYLADSANGIVWKLRYRTGSPSAFKWELVGGSPLTAEAPGDIGITTTTYTDTALGIVLPLAGDYVIDFGATALVNATAGQTTLIAPRLGAAAASDADSSQGVSATVFASTPAHRSIRRNGLAAAATIKISGRVTGGSGTLRNSTLAVRPVRVG